MTVTVKLHDAVLLLPSVRTKLLVVVPFGKVEPLGRPAVWTRLLLEQLSPALTA